MRRVSAAPEARPDADKKAAWLRPLSKPVNLPEGSTLRTLSDAGAYILDLPDPIKRQDAWLRAADLILDAVAGIASVADATAQVELALAHDLTPAGLAVSAPLDRPARARTARRSSGKTWFSALRLPSRKRESRSIAPKRDDKAKKHRPASEAANVAIRNSFKKLSPARLSYSPVRDEITTRLQHWKKAALIFLKLPEETGQGFFDQKVMRRGLYFGLASASMLAALLPWLLRPSSASLVLDLVLCGVTSVLALVSVCALLILNLVD